MAYYAAVNDRYTPPHIVERVFECPDGWTLEENGVLLIPSLDYSLIGKVWEHETSTWDNPTFRDAYKYELATLNSDDMRLGTLPKAVTEGYAEHAAAINEHGTVINQHATVIDQHTAAIQAVQSRAARLGQHDRRQNNDTPAWYMQNHAGAMVLEFKENAILGLTGAGVFSQLLTFTPWHDNSGGYPVQQAITNQGTFSRVGTGDGTWGPWKKALTAASV